MRHAPALALAAGLLLAAGAASAQDHPHGREFMTKAIKGDNSEVTLGHIAARRGASPGVRSFGMTLVRDHSHAKQQAIPVARRLGDPIPTGIAEEAQDEQQKLAHLSGAAFDRSFVDYMVQDHQKDIANFEAEAQSNDPAPERMLARQTLPVLRKHLQIAQRLQKHM